MYLYEVLKKVRLKKQKRFNYDFWKIVRQKQERLLRNVARKFGYKFYKIRNYYIKKNNRNKVGNKVFFFKYKLPRLSKFRFSKRLFYFIKKYTLYLRKLRKYTKFKKVNFKKPLKPNRIISVNKKICNYYNKLANTYIWSYPKYKIWKLKNFFFNRELDYTNLYDSIKKIRKELKKKIYKNGI